MKKIIPLIALLVIGIALSGCPLPPQPDGNGGGNGQGRGGMSFETAIVIQADNEDDGIGQEYEYLEAHACLENGGIQDLEMQVLQEQDGHKFDVMHMICNNGEKEVYYFQIDSFYGKW